MLLAMLFCVYNDASCGVCNVVFNVQIQVIQLIQVMQVDKCRVHCSVVGTNVLKCVYKDASHGVTGAM